MTDVMISKTAAKWFTRLAAGLSVYVGVVTAASTILGDPGSSNLNWIDVGISFGLAYGVYRKSRTWAILLFAYYLGNRVSIYLITGINMFNVATITYGVVFFLGIVGSFAHQAHLRRGD